MPHSFPNLIPSSSPPPRALPKSNHTSISGSSTSESFCLSSEYDSVLETKPTLETQPEVITRADPTIYSFDWSQSESQNSMSASGVVGLTAVSQVPLPQRNQTEDDYRLLPPNLPRPVSWSTITHPEIFKKYIKQECLGPRHSTAHTIPSTPSIPPEQPTAVSAQALPEEPDSKNISNIKQINEANTNRGRIDKDVDIVFVVSKLFHDLSLPVPYSSSLLENSSVWRARGPRFIGDVTFNKPIDTSSEEKAAEWLNDISHSLVTIHNIPPSTTQGNHVFDHRGHNKPLAGGHVKRKPDIVLVDRNIADSIPANARIRWPVVQALIEVSAVNNHQSAMMQTLLSKASVIFEAQLHRRFVLGLAFFGKGSNVRFFLMLIDRAGAICTKAHYIRGYMADCLARILFALACGSDELLGVDNRVTINRHTGQPTQVEVDKQTFEIIQELHVSAYLFSRGTRVYIVKDTDGHYHIFKDSWILTSHESSEIDHIKKISDAVTAENSTDIRSEFLRPRFVAGEDYADDTMQCRGFLRSSSPGRIRRRIITGPIGDPITSYRTRVECLQAFIDIVNQLGFLHDKCGLVHGDISINNIVIVRFLPSILTASRAAKHKCSPTTALNPATDESDSLSYGTEKNLLMDWEHVKATENKGLLCSLGSGGSVIDFDYSRPINTPSLKTSGTMPYMSTQLMMPEGPIEHRLVHDLESVLMVILHIFRFTCGPTRDPGKEVKLDHNISLWYHESAVNLIKAQKHTDIYALFLNPTKYITGYWAPVGDILTKLIDLIYNCSIT